MKKEYEDEIGMVRSDRIPESEVMNYLELAPRCDELDGSTLRIVPFYTEAGYFCEAQCIRIVDKDGREGIYSLYSVKNVQEEEPSLMHEPQGKQ